MISKMDEKEQIIEEMEKNEKLNEWSLRISLLAAIGLLAFFFSYRAELDILLAIEEIIIGITIIFTTKVLVINPKNKTANFSFWVLVIGAAFLLIYISILFG